MTTTRTYDLANRLLKIESFNAQPSTLSSFNYDYNAANQRTLRREADGSYWRYEYDSLGQVISGKKYWSDGTPVPGQQFEYAFDDIGNRTGTKAGGDANGANLRSADYSANLLNQYASRTVPGVVDVMGVGFATNTVTVNSQATYRKGEYFRKAVTVANSSTPVWQSITVSAAGQTSIAGNVLVPRANESFWHDSDGNLLSDSLWTNTWSSENRLVEVESAVNVPGQARMREEWTHLPDGRWIQRIVSTNSGGVYYPAYTNRFVWDRQVLLAILDHTNGVVASFMRGSDLSGSIQGAGGVGGVLAVNFGRSTLNLQPSTHMVSYDGNGNVVALHNAADGAESAAYEYGPFSEPIRVTGPLASLMPLRFSTMYEDNVTGDRKYLFRDYSPSTGRWKSRDPIEEAGGHSLYLFVRNGPVHETDDLGLALYAFGGTLENAGERAANAWWMAQETRESPAWFFPGPNVAGTTSPDIALRVFYQIEQDFCAARKAGKDFTINLTGWSRGAVIAVQVATLIDELGFWCRECSFLRHYQDVKVNWIGVFDAVARMPWGTGLSWPGVVPDNVTQFDHAIKTDTESAYQRLFPTVHYSSGNERAFNQYDGSLTTHADIGESRKRGNNDSYNWIKSQAISAGVKF